MKTTYPKLPKKFKAKWLQALRSGKYDQGSSTMLKDDKYCCLGVGCKVLNIPESEIEENGFPFKSIIKKIPKYFDNNVEGVAEWQDKLSYMNDGVLAYQRAQSFKQIANWIEANL